MSPSLAPRPDVRAAVEALEALATPAARDGLARYGIPSDHALGVAMADIQALAKRLGRHHDLALGLWEAGWHEARLLAAYVDEPGAVTSRQMDQWCRGFDNWAVCDTVCFALFDRTPHAWGKVATWSRREAEFVRRAAFALLWGLTVHDKSAGDGPFLLGLEQVEAAAGDDRPYVMKAVNMALRAIGKRNAALHAAALATAERLVSADGKAARWIGTDARRELLGTSAARRLSPPPKA